MKMDFMNKLKRRLITARERISELEDRITEIQTEEQRGGKKIEEVNRCNDMLSGVLDKEKIFGEILVKILLSMMKSISS